MKITFILPKPGLNGGIRVIATYAEHLQKRGHEILIVSTPSPKPLLDQRLRHLLSGKGWLKDTSKERIPSHLDGRNLNHVVLDSYHPVRDADVPDADVVIATWWETAEWVSTLSPSKGAKVFFVQHHEVFSFFDENRVRATYRLPLHKVVVSRWLQQVMTEEYGDNNVSVVPNSVDTNQFNAPPRGKQAVPTVGLVYSHTYWKGFDVSVKALALVAEKIPNLRIITFGDIDPEEECPLPPNAEYILRPPQGTIKDLYSQCDVWLCGSRVEGFGLPPVEAMACRCPVVTTPVGGLIDIIEPGVNGYLVPIDDPETFAERILQVLQQPELEWQLMSSAAYAKATGYGIEDAVTRFENTLEALVAQQSDAKAQHSLPI